MNRRNFFAVLCAPLIAPLIVTRDKKRSGGLTPYSHMVPIDSRALIKPVFDDDVIIIVQDQHNKYSVIGKLR